MCYKIAVLALVALNALAITALPPCVCTRNLRPVCGSDGNTYSNECLLNCENHKTGGHITMEKEGPCSDAIKVAQPPCTCTEEIDYVCGSDGNTYGNPCQLNCATANDPSLGVKNHGRCDDSVKVANPEPPTPGCFCTYEYNPTCGSDGETYSNPCQLNCATAKNPSLRVQHEGSCGHVNVVNPEAAVPICICTLEYKPICGSDGETYSNPCQLNCATAKNPSLRVQHEGSCGHVNVVNPEPSVPPCICTDDLNEVCGSDGVTYGNPCQLNCATAKNPSLRVQHEGSCGHVNVVNPEPSVPPCICTDDLNEVCGSDGVTYGNPCQLNCATAHNPSLGVQKQGRCESQGHPQGCTCPRDLQPVCGSDGVTYNNMCLLRCAGSHVSLARLAPCELRN